MSVAEARTPCRLSSGRSTIRAMRLLALSFGFLVLFGSKLTADAQSHAKESASKKPVVALHVEIINPQKDSTLAEFAASFRNRLWRNWLSAMPQSAMLGESGKVIVRFQVHKDLSRPATEPSVELSSGKSVKPLKDAALRAIHDSTKKLRFPDAFGGSNIEFRAVFYYNQPADSVEQ